MWDQRLMITIVNTVVLVNSLQFTKFSYNRKFINFNHLNDTPVFSESVSPIVIVIMCIRPNHLKSRKGNMSIE
jgi:hypothetical protein